MTLEQLRIFVAVAERQHVTQAARALNLAQSAASHAIAALEARHQAKLFRRVGRRIELTEAGQVFLDEARAVLARVEAAGLALSEFGGLKRGTLSVLASQTIASYWLPRHLVSFKQAYPQIQIRLTIGNTAQVAAAVENGTAELGFVEGAVEAGRLVCEPVALDQLFIVVGPDHPWAKAGRLSPADLRPGRVGAARARFGHQIGLRGSLGEPWDRAGGVAGPAGTSLQRSGAGRRRGGARRHRDLGFGCRPEPRSRAAATGAIPAA